VYCLLFLPSPILIPYSLYFVPYDGHDIAQLALGTLRVGFKTLATVIGSDVLNLWCNGWCMASRFGECSARCLFCKHDDAPDSIAHICDCHVVLTLLKAFHLRVEPFTKGFLFRHPTPQCLVRIHFPRTFCGSSCS
jgi:hypothetical protein